MRQHLVVICNNLDEAKNAAANLPNFKNVNKFFVFNFNAGTNPNLNWMNPDDDYFSLGKAADLGNNAEICIRSAILYLTNWWQLIFCYANELPSLKELSGVRNAIDMNKGFVQESKCWAISKEHLLLFGLGKILGSGMVKDQGDDLKNEFEIVRAHRGEPASFEAVKVAFLEVSNVEGMVLQGNMPSYKTRAKDFIKYMTDKYDLPTDEPGIIFISPEISVDGINLLMKQISNRTMIAILDEVDKSYPMKEYRKFNCENEFFIKIFIKGE